MNKLVSIGVGLALALSACGSQADDGYHGDPLAVVHGHVITAAPPPAAANVTLVWGHLDGSAELPSPETVTVEGQFPASFELSILSPPDDSELNDFTAMGGKYAIALLSALDPNVPWATPGALLGLCEGHMLVYIPAEGVQPGSVVATFLGGATSPGFHLMKVIPGASIMEDDTLEEVPLSSDVTIRLAPKDELREPKIGGGSGSGSGSGSSLTLQ